MVDAYNSDNLKAKSSEYDPYSELNLSRRNLDEKLADWASTVRSQCKTEQEVHEYLSKKYFGTSDFAYTKNGTSLKNMQCLKTTTMQFVMEQLVAEI